jgi:hypothetical protein
MIVKVDPDQKDMNRFKKITFGIIRCPRWRTAFRGVPRISPGGMHIFG